jgi:hypothetical protein
MVTAVPADWTGYASAAALVALAPVLAGAEMTPSARARAIWELEKLAPCLCEPPGAELLMRAEVLVQTQVAGALDGATALPVALDHGSHVLQRRGRWVHDFALAAMARVVGAAAGELPVPFLAAAHLLRTRSEGVVAVDSDGDSAQLGEDEMDRLAAGDASVLDVPSAALVTSRLQAVSGAASPWPPEDPARALAGLFVLATIADASDAEASRLLAGNRETLEQAIGVLTDADPGPLIAAARARLPHAVRRDGFIVRRLHEDRVMRLAGWPREQQELVLRIVGALAQSAPTTALRRELVTSTIAVLGLGAIARWRPRALALPA